MTQISRILFRDNNDIIVLMDSEEFNWLLVCLCGLLKDHSKDMERTPAPAGKGCLSSGQIEVTYWSVTDTPTG